MISKIQLKITVEWSFREFLSPKLTFNRPAHTWRKIITYIQFTYFYIREFLRKNGTNGTNATWYKTGDTIKNVKLAETLKKIKANAEDFYNGTLAQQIVDDVNAAGGNFSLQDLLNYKVEERFPFETTIKGLKMYTMPPPGSGAVVGMTMNILEGKKKRFFYFVLLFVLFALY